MASYIFQIEDKLKRTNQVRNKQNKQTKCHAGIFVQFIEPKKHTTVATISMVTNDAQVVRFL